MTLERARALSELDIWKLQREFYQRRGIDAWSSGEVPHSITNQPALTRAYVQAVLAYWAGRTGPRYLVEFGSGCGRMAFLTLKELERQEALEDVTYVMTDLARRNLSFWKSHPQLRPFVEAGHLDFAELDLTGGPLHLDLEASDRRLSRLEGSSVFLANYLLDSLPQDVFRIRDGALFEQLVCLESQPEVGDDGTLPELDFEYVERPVKKKGPYANKHFNEVLRSYLELEDTSLLFPVGALRLLEGLDTLSPDGFMLLCADKAWTELHELDEQGPPDLVLHGGCFSMTVNFHALGRFLEHHGGAALLPRFRDCELQLGAFLSHPPTPLLRATCRHWLDQMSPVDLFHIREELLDGPHQVSLRTCLDLMSLSAFDPELLYELSPALNRHLDEANPDQMKELEPTLLDTWSNYYHIGEGRDVAFEIARLYYQADRFTLARVFFEHSMKLYGEHAMTRYNLGLCHYYEGAKGAALQEFKRAQRLGYPEAAGWVRKLKKRSLVPRDKADSQGFVPDRHEPRDSS